MANCAECGKKISFLDAGVNGLCAACFADRNVEVVKQGATEQHKIAAQQEEILQQFKAERVIKEAANDAIMVEIEAIVLTTETVINSPVQKRIKIIMSSVECVFDVKIPKAESELLYDLKRCAYDLGANAVVGVNIQFIETYNVGIGIGEFKKFKMIAYGTAMIIEP